MRGQTLVHLLSRTTTQPTFSAIIVNSSPSEVKYCYTSHVSGSQSRHQYFVPVRTDLTVPDLGRYLLHHHRQWKPSDAAVLLYLLHFRPQIDAPVLRTGQIGTDGSRLGRVLSTPLSPTAAIWREVDVKYCYTSSIPGRKSTHQYFVPIRTELRQCQTWACIFSSLELNKQPS